MRQLAFFAAPALADLGIGLTSAIDARARAALGLLFLSRRFQTNQQVSTIGRVVDNGYLESV